MSFTGEDIRMGINLEWETATEMDNAGFNIWRALSKDGEYVSISGDLIPSVGGGKLGF